MTVIMECIFHILHQVDRAELCRICRNKCHKNNKNIIPRFIIIIIGNQSLNFQWNRSHCLYFVRFNFSDPIADDVSLSFDGDFYVPPDKPPFVPLLFMPIRPSRGYVSSTENTVTVYQLKPCTDDTYLRIGNDGSVSAVERRYDLNSKTTTIFFCT